MKTLYIDCGMGAAGDMFSAALLELLPDKEKFVNELNALGIPGVVYRAEPSEKCGITGTRMVVMVNGEEEESCDGHHHHEHEHGHCHEHEHEHSHHHHSHSGLADIEHIVCQHLPLPAKVKADVMAVYKLIAEAESHAHGVPVTEIHFHEVGTMDAIADITAVCLLMERLAADEIVVSPIHVGSGKVKCAHGLLPVPAPATAYILKDIPIYGGDIQGELCTPTGAALLKHFATRFGAMPVMKPKAVGYGMGKKDFEAANCVRVILGEKEHPKNTAPAGAEGRASTETDETENKNEDEDIVFQLSCNIDDMTGEAIGFATERLFEAGALDVYTVPIGMKKSRPGVMLCAMCREAHKPEIISAIFKHTSTIGIRENLLRRYVLDRRAEKVETPYGPVRCKISSGYGTEHRKYEYDDISRIAEEKGLSIEAVLSEVLSEISPETKEN